MFVIDQKLCTGCAVCMEACPCGAIDMDKEGHCYIIEDLCVDCGACFDGCEFAAIFERDDTNKIDCLKS